jgi:hypothetical protein
MKDRRVQVVDMHAVLHRAEAEVVRRAVTETLLYGPLRRLLPFRA